VVKKENKKYFFGVELPNAKTALNVNLIQKPLESSHRDEQIFPDLSKNQDDQHDNNDDDEEEEVSVEIEDEEEVLQELGEEERFFLTENKENMVKFKTKRRVKIKKKKLLQELTSEQRAKNNGMDLIQNNEENYEVFFFLDDIVIF
jgi:hypothetical protein